MEFRCGFLECGRVAGYRLDFGVDTDEDGKMIDDGIVRESQYRCEEHLACLSTKNLPDRIYELMPKEGGLRLIADSLGETRI